MMCSLYNGNVQIWNFETQNMVKSFEVADVPGMHITSCDIPAVRQFFVCVSRVLHACVEMISPCSAVRCAKFAARKSWVITGSDDMMIRVFNYNTLEKVLCRPSPIPHPNHLVSSNAVINGAMPLAAWMLIPCAAPRLG
jgi:coatomer subunit beta'